MQVQQSGNTQRDRFADALKKIAVDVTAEDRNKAVDEFKITKATVSRYLNGNVQDLDTAANLLTFFKERIKGREKAIA